MTGKKNIFAGTLSCKHLEEVADDISEKELTVQVHMVHENPPANKSRLEETKEQTAKGSKLMKFDEAHQAHQALHQAHMGIEKTKSFLSPNQSAHRRYSNEVQYLSTK